MCVSKSEIKCQLTQKCYDSAEWGPRNIRCQACRFQKCLEVGMNTSQLEMNQEDRKRLDVKLMTRSLSSRDSLAGAITNTLTYLETKLETLRLSAYNPKYCSYGSLEEIIKSTSKISMAEKYGPMPGWPLPKESPKEISTSTRIRDLSDTKPTFIHDRKIWMLFNTFTSIEYAKTFSFFNDLDDNDKLVLAGHTTLMCMFLHDSYYSYSNKFDGNLQPDGSETPLKDESTYSILRMSFGPLLSTDFLVMLERFCPNTNKNMQVYFLTSAEELKGLTDL
ncbi:hypothetical protein CAEBREN_28119 [Caenorhabditis brenneri]|uniref:Nuclear receptor domain-containing protein n=1 Tax=Caenorhabditis brenneri TaxID=135651 RepID=G0NMS8_CAEBE|nr:hypothetical protein CAEBREN_28119 [Caenorhabditis brenneri]